MRSKLPFHRQETPSSCTVARLRMILEHYGFVVSEAELRRRCQTRELGTRVENLLSCARALGCEAEIEYLTVGRLKELLGEGLHPIAYINMFPISHILYTHTVLVESYEGDWCWWLIPWPSPRRSVSPSSSKVGPFTVTWLLFCKERRNHHDRSAFF